MSYKTKCQEAYDKFKAETQELGIGILVFAIDGDDFHRYINRDDEVENHLILDEIRNQVTDALHEANITKPRED